VAWLNVAVSGVSPGGGSSPKRWPASRSLRL